MAGYTIVNMSDLKDAAAAREGVEARVGQTPRRDRRGLVDGLMR
jgi:hypothetical protein